MSEKTVYTIVTSGVDADRGFFPSPQAVMSFLNLDEARMELIRLVETELDSLDSRYDCEDNGEDYWEAYADGYAAGLFTRIEIVTSPLVGGGA